MTARKIIFILILLFFIVCPLPVISAESDNAAAASNTSPQVPFFGHYHALIIGIDDYIEWPPLKTAVRDAEAIKEILVRRYGFSEKNVILRTNRDAGRRIIISDLRKLAPGLGKEDNLFIYFSGHGQLDDLTGDGYWIPAEGALKDPGTWISHSLIKNILSSEKVKCKNIMVIADSCYSGSLFQESTSLMSLSEEGYREKLIKLAPLRSRQIITTGGFKPVVDGPRGGHSLFGDLFFNALSDNPRAIIDLENLCHPILWDNVQKTSGQRPHMGRFKTGIDEGGQFVLFDRVKFIEDEKKRVAEEGKRKEQAQLQAILEERKKLEDERRQFEEEKTALEERKTLEAERIKTEKEMGEKERLAEEGRKEQEQLNALLKERKKLEDERRLFEAEKKALAERKKIEAERINIEKEKLAESQKKEEAAQLAVLLEERKKRTSERQRIEAERKSLVKDSTEPKADVLKLAILPWHIKSEAKGRAAADFPDARNELWRGTVKSIENYKNVELRFSYYRKKEIERQSNIEFIDSKIDENAKKNMWHQETRTSPLEPNIKLVTEYGKTIGADLLLMNKFIFRDRLSRLSIYLIDVNGKQLYKEYGSTIGFPVITGGRGYPLTMNLIKKTFDAYLKDSAGKAAPLEKISLVKDRPSPVKKTVPSEEKKPLATVPAVVEPRIVLRSEKHRFKFRNVKTQPNIGGAILNYEKFNFFDTQWNSSGNFVNDFVDNGDGTITDRVTGLMWQKGGSDKKGLYSPRTKYIIGLNQERFAGHADWRVPTLEELASLLEPKKNKDGIYIDPIFSNISACASVDTFVDIYSNTISMTVSFQYGKVISPKAYYAFTPSNVKAVRSIK